MQAHKLVRAVAGGPGPEAKAKRARLGVFLCWAVVFADIGSSVYYTPGILFGQVGVHAALFVAMTMVVFVLLTLQYAEVAIRYPEGGGVVTVTAHAFSPQAGLLGGLFILVDYFLTAAISSLSGVIYLSVVIPQLKPIVLPVTLVALVVLGVLNLIGISASAEASAIFAVLAAASQIAVVVAVIIHVGLAGVLATFPRVLSGPPHLTPVTVLTGYAGAFLAFSGLESVAQLAPAMREPRRRVAHVTMGVVVLTVAITSPLLTLWSTTLLDARHSDPNQFVSLLGGFAAGPLLQGEVAISGAMLLIFASNTALIGSYHVSLALARLGYLPQVITQRNRRFNTPHWAILLALGIPLLVLLMTRGSVNLLGDLYAFGLLGAFSLTCISLDVVRWHELHAGATAGGTGARITFAMGVLTTVLVVLAWTINLVAKPLATLFGGSFTVAGLLVALVTHRLRQRRGGHVVFPHVQGHDRPVVFITRGRRARPASVLVVLPDDPAQIETLVGEAAEMASGGPVVFLYRGTDPSPTRIPQLFEVLIPYLDDPAALKAFEQAERAARQRGLRPRYVYLARAAGPDAVAAVWRALQPQETLVMSGDEDALSAVAADLVRQPLDSGASIVRLGQYRPVGPVGPAGATDRAQ